MARFDIRNKPLPRGVLMATANPEKLKAGTQVPAKGIFFTLARVPDSGRLFLGGSDFKVSETDLSQPKPEFKDLGKHDSYVTGVALAGKTLVSAGWDGKLIWWDTE